jgi:urease accessory protein
MAPMMFPYTEQHSVLTCRQSHHRYRGFRNLWRNQMKILSLAIATVLAASPALAHVDPAAHSSLAAGITHPIMGTDHVLAMLGTGLLAVMIGGRALWAVPSAFVGAMALGYALALAGFALPMVEPLILASVLVIGALLALAARLSVGAAMALVALFGAAHGAAHGAELGTAGAFSFGVGFVLATAALHLVGILGGLGSARLMASRHSVLMQRLTGAAFALFGGVLALS